MSLPTTGETTTEGSEPCCSFDQSVSKDSDTISEKSFSSAVQLPGDECFVSPFHAENSMKLMEGYLNKNVLTDIVLVAGSKRIPAHRIVLCAASDYFSAMFTNGLRESSQNEVEIQEVDGNALKSLVQYCYTGSVELKEDTVETLLSTACLLQLSAVVTACCSFLRRQLHPSNCIGISLFAEQQGCTELQQSAREYITEHFMDVVRNQEFLLLSPQEVSKLLSSDDLNVPSEESVFKALILWLNHNYEDRKTEIAELLALIRLPLLSPYYLADNSEKIPLFQEDRACQDLIMEALKYHLLPERRSLLQSLRTHPRKSTVGLLYAVGGMFESRGPTYIEKYNLRTNSWSRLVDMSDRRLQCGVAVFDDKLYIVGGREGLKTLSSVECYDTKTNEWSMSPAMSTHRHGLGVAVLEGPLYAVGGHDGWSYLNTVERWDPNSRQWSYVSPMACQRSTLGVAVLMGKLYAVGGRDGSSCLSSVECYDPHTNKWVTCSPMAKRRGGVGVAVLNGYLYAMGGLDAPASNPAAPRFDSVERYNPMTDSWTIVASLSLGRCGIGACMLGDRIFAIGGYDGNNYIALVEAYDAQKNEWQEVAPLIGGGRAGTCAVVVKNSTTV